ncbi:hypothetical protein HUW63_38680 [Myxococcus sp. AM001]|nr:hypothetical protein [Myxococcus sp. AM001]
MKRKNFSNVLMNTETLDWREALYLPKDKSLWGNSCEAIIANPDDYDNDDNPVELSNIGYRYVLLCDDLTSIVSNIREQGVTPDEGLIYDAFIYYLENDALLKV